MILLNIETATEVCSIAISRENHLLALAETLEPFAHSRQITLLIEKALRRAEIELKAIDAVALSQGPGSYTGLRIGAATAKGICYALNKPLLGIDTLAALATAAREEVKEDKALYCPMIDARRMEVYTALYNVEGVEVESLHNKILDESAFQEYFQEGKQIIFTGNGVAKARKIINSPRATFLEQHCSAKHLITIAKYLYAKELFEDIVYFEPLYYKTPNITTPKKLL